MSAGRRRQTQGYDNTTRGGDANRHRGKKFSSAMETAMPAAALAAGGTRTRHAVDPIGKLAARRHVEPQRLAVDTGLRDGTSRHARHR
ncbi:hypothetical protein OH687_32525 [Burkholderia anthina]|nr:hypothetical protein OH687_32525 [Burkholderia anthina]